MYKYVKRLSDIILSLILLIIVCVPMIIIAIMIKLDSSGPVIFKQIRTGKNGENFTLYKFRSMFKDNNMLDFTTGNRVTRVGKIIRPTSLDELPQLFNILKGDMSFIGPRPWIVEYYKNFTPYQKRRVDVTPGITGLAQVNGRNNLTVFEKIEYDIQYVNNLSLWMDLKVLFLTVKAVFSKVGCDLSKEGIYNEINNLKNNCYSVKRSLKVINVSAYKPNKMV